MAKIAAAHRALIGLSPGPVDHVINLAAQAKHLLELRDGPASWLVAERLVRLRRGLIADDLALRAIALTAMGEAADAGDDVRSALTIEPGHPMANRLLLTGTNPVDREQAARRLLGGDGPTALVRDALGVLRRRGVDAAGNLKSAPQRILGWLAWQGGTVLRCRLTSSDGNAEFDIESQPGHRMVGAFQHAADIEWPWPGSADWATLTCVVGEAVLLPPRLWRSFPLPGPRSQPAAVKPVSGSNRRVAVVVPVYDDFEATKRCFDALLAYPESGLARRIIAVDDATPDQRIASLLDGLQGDGRIELLRNDENRGFAASVNRGLAMLAPDEDVVLLNADTVPPPDLCARLAQVAYLREEVGTVTPLSNNGEYTSVPVRFRENPIPPDHDLAALDRVAASTAHDADPVELPNGIGFCLYVKHTVLDAVGLLSLQFGRGYCEDIDFCLRARQAGFRNICATGVFVGHAGSRSFKSEKRALVLTNLSRIDDLHPGYRHLSADFVRRDPLREAVGAMEWKWLLARDKPFALVLGANERDPGAIDRHVKARYAAGCDTIVATLEAEGDGVSLRLRDQAGDYPQNILLSYAWRSLRADLAHDLARFRITGLTLVDPRNLPIGLIGALGDLGMAYDVLLTDADILKADGDGSASFTSVHSDGHALGRESSRIAEVLSRAGTIVTPTPRFRSALAKRRPELVRRIELLVDEPLVDAKVQVAARGTGGLLVVGTSASADEDELIDALCRLLRQVDSTAGVVVDGKMTDELGVMELGNVFVLGPGLADGFQPTTCRVPASGIVFPSRRWGMSDRRVEAAVALGLPVAYFDPTVERSQLDGGELLLSTSESLASVVAMLGEWWLGLAAIGPVEGPASTVSATLEGPRPG